MNSMSQSVRRAATGLIGLAAAWRGLRFAGSSLKAFADFETSLARVSTMLDDQTAHFLPEYEIQIAKLAIRYGQTTKALSKGTFDIISGSFKAADAMEFLEVATRSAIGGFTDVATSVKAMVAILNAYGLSAKDASRVTGVMSAIVAKGVIEYDELAGSIGLVVPIAASAGLSLEELAGAIATITQKGVNARITMTALKAVIATFMAPTPDSVKAAEKFDLVLNTATLRAEGLTGALGRLKDASAEETAAIFTNMRALIGVESTRNTIVKLIENYEAALNSLGLDEINYQKVAATTNQLLARNRELWVSIKRELGKDLAPIVNEWLASINEIATDWDGFLRKMRVNTMKHVTFMQVLAELGVAGWKMQTNEAVTSIVRARIKANLKLMDAEFQLQRTREGAVEAEVAAAKQQEKTMAAIRKLVKENDALYDELGNTIEGLIGPVKKFTDAEKKANQTIKDLFKELAFERRLLGMTNDERERAVKLLELEKAAKDLGVDASRALKKAYEEELIEMQKLSRQAEKDEAFAREFEEDRRNILRGPLIAMLEDRELEEVFKAGLARLGTTIVEHMYEKTIVDPLMQALEDTIDPAMEKIADKMMDHLSELADNVASLLSTIFGGIINVVGGAIGGGIGGLFGGAAAGGAAGSITGAGISGISLPAAHGAVFNNASVTPFARGGILDGPTVFPMANGGLALGGEAGHEALMPLKRDSSGRLGVTSADGGESGGTSIKIINVLDDSMFSEYLSTGDGEREIVNIMRRNASEVTGI